MARRPSAALVAALALVAACCAAGASAQAPPANPPQSAGLLAPSFVSPPTPTAPITAGCAGVNFQIQALGLHAGDTVQVMMMGTPPLGATLQGVTQGQNPGKASFVWTPIKSQYVQVQWQVCFMAEDSHHLTRSKCVMINLSPQCAPSAPVAPMAPPMQPPQPGEPIAGAPGAPPGAPAPQYQQPGAPAPQYQQPGAPAPQYQQPGAPQYQQPGAPQYQQPGAPQYQQPGAPQYQQPQYQQPGAPAPQYQQPGAPAPQYQQPGAPAPQYQQPGAPAPQYQQPPQPQRPAPERPAPHKDCAPLFMYLNTDLKDHFYTTNFKELYGGKLHYKFLGVASGVYDVEHPGTIPVYRYFNDKSLDHIYTLNYNTWGKGQDIETPEGDRGHTYEGVAFYVYKEPRIGLKPMYMFINHKTHNTMFSLDKNNAGVHSAGYVLAGQIGYAGCKPK